MKLISLVLAAFSFSCISYSQSSTSTYTAGAIPTSMTTYSATCNGPVTSLVVTIPAGANVTSISVGYNMTAIAGAWRSEQRSQISCQQTGNTEAVFSGLGGNVGGTEVYNRAGVTIANGISATGILTFEMRAWRTWGGAACDAAFQSIDNNTWTITVFYNIPGPMSYVSSTTTQGNTSGVQNCATIAEIMGIQVVTTGSTSPLTATQFTIGTAGTTSLANLNSVNVYYTGTSSTFATGTLFGTVAPGGTVVVNGSQVLATGTNYFWIQYGLNPIMTNGNNLDATCTGINVGSAVVPTITAPAGQRTIGACNPSPGGVLGNLQAWFNGNVGTIGNPVTTWNNQGPNASIPSVTSANGGPLSSSVARANFNNTVACTGDFNGTYHRAVPDRTNLIAGNGVTMYCAYQRQSVPDLCLNFHSSVSGGGGESLDQWRSWGFRHAGLGALFSNGVGAPYNLTTQAQMSENSGFLGMHGTQNAAGGTSMNGSEMNIASTGTWYTGTSDMELSIGYWPGFGMSREVMEAIVWDKDLNATERFQVETYLAIKYGITLGMNGTSMNYISPSNGSIVWNVASNAGFNFDIAGISRSDVSGLDQRKSHSTNGVAVNSFNDIVTIANGTNFASPALFTQDGAFLMWGHDNGPKINTGVIVNYPTDNGEIIQSIFQREWKSQESGTVNSVTLEFDLNAVVGVGGVLGNNDLQYLRLLIDEDGDYSDGGATSVAPSSYNNTTNIAYFTVDFVPPSGPETTQLRGFFFTLGSTNVALNPLPVELVNYTVTTEECVNRIEWATASELNSSSFTIERSYNMVDWEHVAIVQAAGNSNSLLNYSYRDNEYAQNGLIYYRILQEDFDGTVNEIGLQAVNAFCSRNEEPIAYPNPVTNQLSIKSAISGTATVTDINGRIIAQIELSEGVTSIEMTHLSPGSYLLQLNLSNGKSYIDQFVKF